MLRLAPDVYKTMVAHCLDGLPDEACGLIASRPGSDKAVVCYPARNAAESARIYTVDPKDVLRADRDAEARGLEVAGVFHSHTHTEAYPSATDVRLATYPESAYVIVSLADRDNPSVRAFRIVDGAVTEMEVEVR